jgi:hypothetical protein
MLIFLHLSDFLLFIKAIPSDPHAYAFYYFPLIWPTFLFYAGFTSLLISLAHGLSLTGFLAIFVLKISFSIVDGSPAGAFLAATDLIASILKLAWLHETSRAAHPERLDVKAPPPNDREGLQTIQDSWHSPNVIARRRSPSLGGSRRLSKSTNVLTTSLSWSHMSPD